LHVSLTYRQQWRATIEVGRVTPLMGLQIVDVDAFSAKMTLTVIADVGITVGFRKFPPSSITILGGSKVPGLSQKVVLQGQMAPLQDLLSELLVEGVVPGIGYVKFTIDDGGGTGISDVPSLNSTFSLQVWLLGLVCEYCHNLTGKYVLTFLFFRSKLWKLHKTFRRELSFRNHP
jgi:hypothetical protein